MPKKIVQISATQDADMDPVCFALCEDGSLLVREWVSRVGWRWQDVTPMLDDEEKDGEDA